MKCENCIHYGVCVVNSYCHEPCGYYEEERPHGECKTCKHFVRGGLDGKTYVCEHPKIELDDQFVYACIMMNENDFCSQYEKEGEII